MTQKLCTRLINTFVSSSQRAALCVCVCVCVCALYYTVVIVEVKSVSSLLPICVFVCMCVSSRVSSRLSLFYVISKAPASGEIWEK